jgi:hypothetical protein
MGTNYGTGFHVFSDRLDMIILTKYNGMGSSARIQEKRKLKMSNMKVDILIFILVSKTIS